jgi:class 3 adenylate cyclase/tetratricopeptide (TPR) repeat protein
MQQITDWLKQLGMDEYIQRFAENDIDFAILSDLTDQDLEKIGVTSLGHRRKLLRAIAKLKGIEQSAVTIARATPRAADAAERRQLTVLFSDLVGSTVLAARMDPEDLREVISAYQKCVAETVRHFDGFVARYLGDGVLVYFGYPQAHEDDAERAVRAGLELIAAVAGLRTGASLQARVGIATGLVVVGDLIGSGAAQEQAVVGETPNLAARLQALAEPGTVLICPSTRRLTGGHFNYRDPSSVTLKGWAEPVLVWQVVGSSGVESRFEAMHTAKLPPLVGREEEIELLLRRWRDVARGQGRVVVLTGEPGIGKSHVALALDERLKGEPHITLRYYCSPHHANSALFPFISQLEHAAGIARGDSPEEKLSKLGALLAQPTPNREHLAVLANLLALPVNDGYRMEELSPQKRREKTLAALLAQLKGLAARRPVYVIFEDIHWIDPTSLEVLIAVVEQIPQLPVLLLVTARPEFTPPWPSYPHMMAMQLARLGRRDGTALVVCVTGGKTLPKEVMDEILIRTDGVPLFVEELTKTVLESGLLQERNGHYVLDHPLPPLAIPTTLQGSLMARIDRLSPVREVAQIGAVAGREFHYELLNAVAGLPRKGLEDALDRLVQSELIFRRGEIPRAVYTFKHALVRDAAYASLLKRRREQLHAAIAKALEQQFPEVTQHQPETLAHHFSEAGLIEKAIGYWLQAGRNAALRSANLEAIAHLERGIEATGHLRAGEGRDRSELEFRLALGPCVIATHGAAASKAVSTFARARELCAVLGEPSEYLQVVFWQATARVVRGELPQALEAIADLPHDAEARGNRAAFLNVIRGQGMILMFMGRLVAAREALTRALDAFDSCGEADRLAARAAGQDAGVSILVLMAWVLWLLGQVDEAVARMTAALERADAVEHAHTHAYAWYYAAVLYGLLREPAVAQGYAERCLAISEQREFRHWLGLSRALVDICAASAGRLGEAKEALNDYQRVGYNIGLTAQHVLLCSAHATRQRA